MMKSQRTAMMIIGCAVWGAILASPANGTDVNPGHDLFETLPGATQEFGTGGVDSAPPIPADFFGPGSDPFVDTISLASNPLGTFSGFDVGRTDTIVRRLVTANVPNVGDSDTIPIEVVALSLTSISPITVTFNGGQNPESWDLDITLSPSAPSPGTMTINHSAPGGGTYDADMDVFVLFTFTRVSDNTVRTLDSALIPYNANVTTSNSPNWEHEPTNGQGVVPGLTGDESNLVGAPWTNDFYIFGTIEHTGPHPVRPAGGACCFNTDGDLHHDTCDDDGTLADCDALGGWFEPLASCSGIIGVCCLDWDLDGHHDTCLEMDEYCCLIQDGWFDPDASCSGVLAGCCLDWDLDGHNDLCVDMDVTCCKAQGGTPTDLCSGKISGCCLDWDLDGHLDTCVNMDQTCCKAQGGAVKDGPCSEVVGACCLDWDGDGEFGDLCVVMDQTCCKDEGGVFFGGGSVCLGDVDPENGIDDTCEGEIGGACCVKLGKCANVMDEAGCDALGGFYKGDGTSCSDPGLCSIVFIPAVSQWGVALMIVLVLTVGTLAIRGRRAWASAV